ncbi:2-dehydro-3-deoxygluconokinase [Bacillus xiamenensis]|uniref:2-dehydro-3-deoxygluconokinase n=2 Tax=Bacillus xiamenensis TaxID=1178537 RepID=A0AAC9II08_9BACI|nr:sugar kinase [Bacillus xiamenensis]AOZ89103.1 2-dehydro-3-deoxygluconokinase [Bacillus xiamenensis]
MKALDVITFGESMAMFYAKEIGELHQVNTFQKALAGAESNVAIGLARLGFEVGWMSKVGADSLGTFVLEELQKEGVDTNAVLRSNDGSQTGILLKSKVINGDPDVTYYRKGSAASTMNPSDFPSAYFNQAGHLHLTGIPPAVSSEMRAFSFHALKEMKGAGKTISFDPNLRFQLWEEEEDMIHTVNQMASQVDWFFPGLAEGQRLTGCHEPEEIADVYLQKGVKLVVIKLGAEGAFFKSAAGQGIVEGFHVQDVVDTVGAGDGFAVGVISGLLDGLSYEKSVTRGNAIGALAVMSPGDHDGLPTREKLQAFMKEAKRYQRRNEMKEDEKYGKVSKFER